MSRLLKIFAAALTFAAAPVFAGGYTIGFSAGFQPNPYELNDSVGEAANQVQAKADTTSGASVVETSSGLAGIPFGFNVRYLERFYILRLGTYYHLSLGGSNTVKVDGRNVTVEYETRRFEMPATFALNLKNDAYTRLYAGAGLTLFHGSIQVTKDNGRADNPDADLYSGWALGYHIMFGTELALTDKLAISAEIFFQVGNLASVADESVTPAGKSGIQDGEDEDNPEVLGVHDPNRAMSDLVYDPNHPDGLIFTGVQLLIGFNYYL